MCEVEADPRLALAYDESIRGWALQSSVLDELRGRAGVLLSAASVASAFLGAIALEGMRKFSALSIAGTVAFGCVVLLCVYVLWPAKWTFVHNAENVITTYVDKNESLDQLRKKMAIENTTQRIANKEKLDRRFIGFQIACLGLGVDVVLWLIDIGTKG